MIESYFNCLMEIDNIKHEISEIISFYIRDKNISVMEVILLHIIINKNGSCFIRDVVAVTKKISSNNCYNINSLVNKGFLKNEKGKLLGLDGRCHKLTVTKSGMEFYKVLCNYIVDKFKQKNINLFDPILKEITCLRNNISYI